MGDGGSAAGGMVEGFATQKNLVHLPENRFWNPKSESRIIENDARIQKILNQNQESLKMTPEFKNDSRLEKKTLQINYYASINWSYGFKNRRHL
jgi:hypothetical protein